MMRKAESLRQACLWVLIRLACIFLIASFTELLGSYEMLAIAVGMHTEAGKLSKRRLLQLCQLSRAMYSCVSCH